MAIIQHLTTYPLSSLRLGDFALGTVGASATSVSYTLGNRVLTLTGTFMLSGGVPVAGVISGLGYSIAGAPQFAVSAMNLTFQAFELAMGDDRFDDVLATADRVTGTSGEDRLNGFGGDDQLIGGAGNDSIYGGQGDDTLEGRGGADLLQGGSGDDVYRIDAADRLVEFGNSGIDRVETSLTSYTLGANLENLTHTARANFTGTGNGLDNLIIGGAGNDSLAGLDGNDTLRGGNGADTLNGGNGNDWLIGDAGASSVTTSSSAPSPSDPSRPITLSMTLPEVSAGTTTTVTGYVNNATLSTGAFNLAFVIDVSGSMDATFAGSAVGDRNGDGSLNTRLDAAIAAFESLVASIEAAGLGDAVRIALIPFESASQVAAIGSTSSDVNGNGVADVIEAARGLDELGGTDYGLGLTNAVNFFNGSPNGDNYLFFLSDGEPNGSAYADQLAALRDPGGINAAIRALGIGAGNSGTYYNVLDLLDDGVLNGSALNVVSPDDLAAGLLNSQVNTTDIAGLEIWLNGVLLVTLTPDQLTETPFGLQYSYTIPGLNPAGADLIETRVVLAGQGGYISTSQVITVGTLVSDDRLIGGAGNDKLDGGAGVDVLIGGLGDDIYVVDSSTDSIVELAGQGIDAVESTVSFTLFRTPLANVENLTLLGSTDLSGTGNALANRLQGNIGNNLLEGLGGNDTLIGGFGVDTATFARQSAAVVASLATGLATSAGETDVLSEIEGLIGSAFNDSLTGNTGDNTFAGGAGNDTINGSNGRDTLDFANASSAVTVNLNVTFSGGTTSSANGAEGIDQVAAIENVIGSRFGDVIRDSGSSSNLANAFFGGAGNDELYGGDGNDTLYGGAGNDTLDGGIDASSSQTDIDLLDYSAEGAAVRGSLSGVIRGTTIGSDTVVNFEHVIATAFNDSLVGAALAERIDGGDGADTLRGGAGNDTLIGGAGNDQLSGDAGDDVFYVDRSGDVVSESAGGGTDTVFASVSYAILDADVESLTLLGIDNINGTGNASANTLNGNAGNNLLSGRDGNDTILAGLGNDTVLGGEGADSLNGGTGDDVLSYAGSLSGVIGTLNSTGTAIFQTASGNDTITAFEDVIGSGFADALTGDFYENRLSGGAGNDSLYGGSSNDTLDGGSGNDVFDGGSGTDTLDFSGLAGLAALDVDLSTGILTGDGTDLILNTSIEVIIGTNRADVIAWKGVATSTYTDFILSGGGGADSLQGSFGDDTLDGGIGADTMNGGSGWDTYVVDNAGDVLAEAQFGGTDTVIASINYALASGFENLTLTGAAQNGTGNELFNRLVGNDRGNVLSGGDGGDTITGGLGRDTMSGGSGTDYFVFDDPGETPISAMDLITDFDTSDYLQLSQIDASTVGSGNNAFTFIGLAAFNGIAGELRYETVGGETRVLGDLNGDGVADIGIRLSGIVTLTSSDIFL